VHPVEVLVASAGRGLTAERMRIAQELWSAYVPASLLLGHWKLYEREGDSTCGDPFCFSLARGACAVHCASPWRVVGCVCLHCYGVACIVLGSLVCK
jgi:hypothetical protein